MLAALRPRRVNREAASGRPVGRIVQSVGQMRLAVASRFGDLLFGQILSRAQIGASQVGLDHIDADHTGADEIGVP